MRGLVTYDISRPNYYFLKVEERKSNEYTLYNLMGTLGIIEDRLDKLILWYSLTIWAKL